MQAAGELPDRARPAITAEPPCDPAHGDIDQRRHGAGQAGGQKPRDIADALSPRRQSDVTHGAVAGLRQPQDRRRILARTLRRHACATALPMAIRRWAPARVNVEYVSAKPDRALRGHARGAVVGDVLANLLIKAGYAVTGILHQRRGRAGRHARPGRPTWRYRSQALGETIGEIPTASIPASTSGSARAPRWRGAGSAKPAWMDWLPAMRDFAIAMLMTEIKADLETLGVAIEVYSSERALVDSGAVDRAFRELDAPGLIYRPPRSAEGQDADDWEDRELRSCSRPPGSATSRPPAQEVRTAGPISPTTSPTTPTSCRRGCADMIDIWGADHGGHVKRMKAAVAAVTEDRALST